MLPPVSFSPERLFITWLLSNLEPGDRVSAGAHLRGNSAATDHIDLTLDNRMAKPSNGNHYVVSPSSSLAQDLELVCLTWGDQDLLPLLIDVNDNGLLDLDDLRRQGLVNLQPAPSATQLSLEFAAAACYHPVRPDPSVRNLTLACTFAFALHQQPHPAKLAGPPARQEEADKRNGNGHGKAIYISTDHHLLAPPAISRCD